MKRLRDMEGDEPLFQRGVEVLQGTPPTAEMPDVKQRVWRSIQRAPATTPRRLPILIPKLALVAIVAFGAGTAGAVIAHRWQRGNGPRARQRGVVASAIDAAARRAPKRRARSRRSPTPPPPWPTRSRRARAREPRHEARRRSSPACRRARRRSRASGPRCSTRWSRLRREHDPVRAGTLLARYLSAHPRGALREEALVLAIEAADARGDQAGGEQLAHAYQAEFPAGRFLPFARSHTDGHGSH